MTNRRTREAWTEAKATGNWEGYTYEQWVARCEAFDRQLEADQAAQREGKTVRVGPVWHNCLSTDLDELTPGELEGLQERVAYEIQIQRDLMAFAVSDDTASFEDKATVERDVQQWSITTLLDWLQEAARAARFDQQQWHTGKPVDGLERRMATDRANEAAFFLRELLRRASDGDAIAGQYLADAQRRFWPAIREAALNAQ